jgi:hypothetical protein
VVAATIVEAAVCRGLKLSLLSQVRETMGAGLEGMVDGCAVRAICAGPVYTPLWPSPENQPSPDFPYLLDNLNLRALSSKVLARCRSIDSSKSPDEQSSDST